jgi:hypothetical protein
MRYQKWECGQCKETFITDKLARWDMVGCKAGRSAVDAEEHYSRFMGSPKLVKESDDVKDLDDE